MNDLHEALLFFEDLPPRQREEILERLESDPDVAEAFVQWRAIERRVAQDLQKDLPERHLLVLFALEDDGDRSLLSTQEQMALDEARGDIERAIKRHPSLNDRRPVRVLHRMARGGCGPHPRPAASASVEASVFVAVIEEAR